MPSGPSPLERPLLPKRPPRPKKPPLLKGAAIVHETATAQKTATAAGVPAVLDAESIVGNAFANLTLAVWERGELGHVRCDDNFARSCTGASISRTALWSSRGSALIDALRKFDGTAGAGMLYRTLLFSAQLDVYDTADQFAHATRCPPDTRPPRGCPSASCRTRAIQKKCVPPHPRQRGFLASYRAAALKPTPKRPMPCKAMFAPD